MEYYRVSPPIGNNHIPDAEVNYLASKIIFTPGEDCGAKIVGLFYGRDEDDATFREFIDRSDAMVLTSHVYGSNLNLWFVGFGSEEAEMLAKLTLV